ncbi:integration host factor subunit beta [bacterium]|jgi:nucleoid DNA-binding protein|nr:integration host factor subunit beta [Mariniblastus sp.]MDA7913301.1 integration host factor subunit beta [bacterium]MDB4472953.1 integration host factor subunit beta [bacterium]
MTKKEIVRRISEELGIKQTDTKEVVQRTFDAIIEALATEQRVELRNFGVFEVKKRAARKARNPKTGEQVLVPARFVVTFKPGKEMEQRVKTIEEDNRFKESGFMPDAKAELDSLVERQRLQEPGDSII